MDFSISCFMKHQPFLIESSGFIRNLSFERVSPHELRNKSRTTDGKNGFSFLEISLKTFGIIILFQCEYASLYFFILLNLFWK